MQLDTQLKKNIGVMKEPWSRAITNDSSKAKWSTMAISEAAAGLECKPKWQQNHEDNGHLAQEPSQQAQDPGMRHHIFLLLLRSHQAASAAEAELQAQHI